MNKLKSFKSKLQVLSFMFTPNCSRCPLPLKLTGFVLNVSKSCRVCSRDEHMPPNTDPVPIAIPIGIHFLSFSVSVSSLGEIRDRY
ncbi:hypothetical protein Hanom_Chr12g01115181 [Helianthus anomalus]